MKIFAQLPADIRRALARRELAKRGLERPAAADRRLVDALEALDGALEALLPNEPVVYSKITPYCREVAFPQPPRHREKVAALAKRIASDTTTAADLAVLLALPADALATLEMSPAEFVTWIQSIDDSA